MFGINGMGNNLRLAQSFSSDMQLPLASKPSADFGTVEEGFGKLLKDAVQQVNQLEDQAQVAVEGLMSGSGIDVHQALIAAEKASMAFDLALAVRNKAIQSYQSIMGMQF